jgi:hypothetical protein
MFTGVSFASTSKVWTSAIFEWLRLWDHKVWCEGKLEWPDLATECNKQILANKFQIYLRGGEAHAQTAYDSLPILIKVD